MKVSAKSPSGGRLGDRRAGAGLVSLLGLVLATYCPSGGVLAQTDYLRAIEAEAEKVAADPGGRAPQSGPVSAAQGADRGRPARVKITREAFERSLSDNFHGSYTFYKRLPEPTRAELFDSYAEGASMQEIRAKIMNRFLKQ